MADIGMKEIRPEFFVAKNEKCRSCKYKTNNAGTHHVGCSKKMAHVSINPHGLANGWAYHPFDFDPIWIEACDSYVNVNHVNLEDREELLLQISYQMTWLLYKMNHLKNLYFGEKMQEIMKSQPQKPKEEFSIEELNALLYELLNI